MGSTVDQDLLFINLLPSTEKIRLIREIAPITELNSMSDRIRELLVSSAPWFRRGVFARTLERTEIELEKIAKSDQKWLTLASNHYPPLLREIAIPPVVLYYRGDINILKQPTLSIVGSRKATFDGLRSAREFAEQLAHKIIIVSGGAFGIDATVHWAVVRRRGPTAAVFGCGIDVTYPASHQNLYVKIIESGGVLISEFPLNSRPLPYHFPQRNRILAGLSSATLVIEAGKKSGSLITARHATESNRDVFVIPTGPHNPNSEGILFLLESGAIPINRADQLFEHRPFSEIRREAVEPTIND